MSLDTNPAGINAYWMDATARAAALGI